ncbi:class I SAM-dependent methyltransferase [Mycolicibacterium sp. Y3]
MTNSLQSPSVAAVLHRLLTTEQEHDPAEFARVPAFPLDLDAAQRAELFRDVYMSVSDAGGRLLYLLARATGARRIVEYGTSFGVSTLYLAGAVRDNGGGTVIATEMQQAKAAAAQRNFTESGLDDLIELRTGDALQTLATVPFDVDLLLLDGWPDLALDVLRLVEPRLRAGALVLVDDVDMDWGSDVHGPLLTYLDESGRYVSLTLPVGDGIRVAVYTP